MVSGDRTSKSRPRFAGTRRWSAWLRLPLPYPCIPRSNTTHTSNPPRWSFLRISPTSCAASSRRRQGRSVAVLRFPSRGASIFDCESSRSFATQREPLMMDVEVVNFRNVIECLSLAPRTLSPTHDKTNEEKNYIECNATRRLRATFVGVPSVTFTKRYARIFDSRLSIAVPSHRFWSFLVGSGSSSRLQ